MNFGFFSRGGLFRCLAISLSALLPLSAFSADAQAPVAAAQVVFAKGEAAIVVSGKAQALQAGASIAEGALLQTGDDGYLYLKLADDGFLVLRPKTQARIVAYRPVPERPAESVFRLELIGGVVRAITGNVAEKAKDRFRLNTPVAAIGVKGTDFVVSASAEATYVSVYSGAVVASPFMADCARNGLGSCKSSSATTLLASNDALLEIRAGSQNVQVIDLKANPALRRLLPDQVSPPGNSEGALRSQRSEASALPATSLTMAENPTTASELLRVAVVPTSAAVVTPPVAAVESAQKIFWGRWAPVAGLGGGVDLAEFVKNLEPVGISWPSYVVARVKDGLVMPGEGVMSFNLRSSEAGIFVGNNSTGAIPAQIQNSALEVDFGRRQFSTQLTVAGGGYAGTLVAKGAVLPDGVFEYSAGRSNMSLSGGLSGNPADQAAYTFMGRIGANAVAAGGTFWRKAP